MVDGGIVPEIAYMLMAVFKFDGEDGVTVGYTGNNHFPVDDGIGTDSVINFLKKKPKEIVRSFKEKGGYNHVCKWGQHFGIGMPKRLSSYFEKIFDKRFPLVKGGFGGYSGGSTTCEELISIVLEYQGTLLKEFV